MVGRQFPYKWIHDQSDCRTEGSNTRPSEYQADWHPMELHSSTHHQINLIVWNKVWEYLTCRHEQFTSYKGCITTLFLAHRFGRIRQDCQCDTPKVLTALSGGIGHWYMLCRSWHTDSKIRLADIAYTGLRKFDTALDGVREFPVLYSCCCKCFWLSLINKANLFLWLTPIFINLHLKDYWCMGFIYADY